MNNKLLNDKIILWELYFEEEKKCSFDFRSDPDQLFHGSDPDQLFHEANPRIRIQIKMKLLH